MFRSKFLTQRLKNLESHLQAENPLMLDILPTYYKLDKLLYRQGLLDKESSLATRISWWPVISILGTFSSGKSTFINHFLGDRLQSTGNQAVDDKFTVICFTSSGQEHGHTLPGTALDGDARFPFYRMSREIDKVAEGEGKRIETYLQLKTTGKDTIRGKILIDSPGFDADDQRSSVLRLTDHIIDLSDLVLVFFDARHPEPGAMQDTLRHLVSKTVTRTDASKFLYILNQIDTTAREDNPEDVVGAWQRAIAQAGLASGRFYCIYNPEVSVPIEDAALRARFEHKRDEDLSAIHGRMGEVEVQRAYRVVRILETVINEVENEAIPRLNDAIGRWRRMVLWGDAAGAAVAAAVVAVALYLFGWPITMDSGFLAWFRGHWLDVVVTLLVAFVISYSFHLWIRDVMARRVAKTLSTMFGQVELNLRQGFLRNTRILSSVFRRHPAGWGPRMPRRLRELREQAAQHVQRLNDRYADPSGRLEVKEAPAPAPAAEPPASEEADTPQPLQVAGS